MKRNILSILGMVMILAMLLSACQPAAPAATTAPAAPAASAATTAQAAGGKKITVGLVQIDLSNPFHIGEVEGAKEAARRYGFNLEVTSGEGDVNKQVTAFENLINKKVDVIAANFIDIKAFGPALQKAKAANIPVVCLHSYADGCAIMLGFDERYTGQSVGDYAIKLLTTKNGSPKGEVANLQGLLGQGLNEDRTGGFMDVMAKYPDIKVDAKEPTNWDPKKAADITETWLTAYPKLDLIYGNSDSLTVPASTVIQNANKGSQIIMVSIDGSDSGLKAVKDGQMKSTFLYDPQYTGFYKAWIPFRIASGEKVDQKFLIKGVLVTSENVDPILKLSADQNSKIQDFPFEKPLVDIVNTYLPAGSAAPAAATSPAAPAASAATTAPAAGGKKVTVGLVQIDLSNPFHIGEVEGAKEAARRYGFNLEVTSGEGDVNKQVTAFENLINKKVDVIAANFIDIKAFGPALQKAKAANIPVVCLHSYADGCVIMLGFDERYTGQSVGDYAIKLLTTKNGSPKGEVANLQGLLGQGLNEDRTGGFMDVMAKYPDIKVDAKEPTNWDPKKAADITETWLTAYPKLDLIYGNSDSLTVPASTVIQNANKGSQIILVSIDGSDSGLKAVKDGLMKSTFLYDPQYTGFYKAWIPFRIASGEKVDQKFLIKGVLVTNENVDPILKLSADQSSKIQDFPFEKPLVDIVSTYLGK